MSMSEDEARYDEFISDVIAEAYPEHAEQAVAEFTTARLQSHYLANPNLAEPALRALAHARGLLAARDATASLVFAAAAMEDCVRRTRTWTRVTPTVSCAEHQVEIAPWGQRHRIVVYRSHVQHETAKNFQLDLFDPRDGHYEYSAVVTNKPLGGPALWAFMCGRGVHEKVYGELKSGFAFACVPTMQYAANSAWQLLSVLAFNLSRSFQLATTAHRRSASRKRRPLFGFETIHTLSPRSAPSWSARPGSRCCCTCHRWKATVSNPG
ncbi:MAG: hypothetical protein U0807_15135 [Candidatus Binatia bacterium]